MKTMIFGVFDGLHEGHKYFIEQARQAISPHPPLTVRGGAEGAIVIVVARDSVVQKLKNKLPQWHELKRMEILKQNYPEATVVLGDEEQGRYNVIEVYKPDVLCLGYDQQALGKDLQGAMERGIVPTLPLVYLKPHKPELYKSSKIV